MIDLKEKLLSLSPVLATRKISIHGGARMAPETWYINYVNLPIELKSPGAEEENNRMMFTISYIGGGRYKLEHMVSVFPREYRLRGKSAKLDDIVNYLAQFLTKVANEVSPKYTHTKTPI